MSIIQLNKKQDQQVEKLEKLCRKRN